MKKNIRYCLPIIANSKKEVLAIVNKHKTKYQLIEIWLSPIKDFDLKFADDLIKILGKKLILIFRHPPLLKSKISSKDQENILTKNINKDFFVDYDIELQKKELKFLFKKNLFNKKIKLITSFHNYKKTPRISNLKEKLINMQLYNPHIKKISTLALSQKDSLNMLQLGLTIKNESRIILLCMGKDGVMTRIFATIWFNEWIYAPISKDKESAPFQITYKELKKIFNVVYS